MKYDFILNEYPETITKEQIYRILHISKRKAKWLLDIGYIKCKNSEKKTRKYTIKTKDLIKFLQDYEIHPEKYPIPEGYFSNMIILPERSIVFTDLMKERFRIMLENEWIGYADALTLMQISKMLGYSKSYMSKLLTQGKIKSIQNLNKRIVPKEWLIYFIVEAGYSSIRKKSQIHRDLLEKIINKT